jgi:two-component system, LytTR family, response regulator LytT
MKYYILRSRLLSHILFWALYYLLFGFIWAKNGDFFSSYFLEFILMPVRIAAAYFSIYYLVPRFLVKQRYLAFGLGYISLIVLAGLIQRIFTFYYYDFFVAEGQIPFFSIAALGRSIILVNSTVLTITALKVIQLYYSLSLEKEPLSSKPLADILTIKSDKRYYRVPIKDIRYIESLGNYVTYHLRDRKLISYDSLAEVTKNLPAQFIRVHKSYIINKDSVSSYNNDDIELGDQKIPLGRSYKDQLAEAF